MLIKSMLERAKVCKWSMKHGFIAETYRFNKNHKGRLLFDKPRV